MSFPTKIRVLVVDDSAVVRRAIVEALSHDPEIEVVGTASDPYIARDRILELNPDVLTLDVEMPRMDGLVFLRTLLLHRPIRVVIVSSVTQNGSKRALEALASGAVDVLAKPNMASSIGELRDQLPYRIKGAARARLNIRSPGSRFPFASVPSGEGSVSGFSRRQIILIGASTGGTEAIKNVLGALPDGLPGICIVQHIPAVFSAAFASRLNEHCNFEVCEARSGDEVRPGLALVAPGDFHMSVALEGGIYRVHLEKGPMLHYTRPAVDVLFNSAAQSVAQGSVAVLLTGMGSDGARGMLKLKQKGVCTIAQNEATCAVYGMPRAAVEMGAVEHLLPLDQIPNAILTGLQAKSEETRHAQIDL
jgi:two-component system chemotaxis response regulator CheB